LYIDFIDYTLQFIGRVLLPQRFMCLFKIPWP